MGRPGASDAEVADAALRAEAADFIARKPGGYGFVIGERGTALSGGERQRLAIARAVLKNAPVLILDEATSALDTHTEREIQANLREVSRGRTTLVIAHRLSTVVDADEIIVLERGQVAERGTHGELLGRAGIYAAMWNRQRQVEQAREILKEAEEDEEDERPVDTAQRKRAVSFTP